MKSNEQHILNTLLGIDPSTGYDSTAVATWGTGSMEHRVLMGQLMDRLSELSEREKRESYTCPNSTGTGFTAWISNVMQSSTP